MKKCNHAKVSFLGMQETLTPSKKLALYNCLACKTTISKPVTLGRTARKK